MPAAKQRGQGQWALGHFEPLNAAERFRKDDAGLNVRDRIIARYAEAGFGRTDLMTVKTFAASNPPNPSRSRIGRPG